MHEHAEEAGPRRTLYVDLDGTLVATDLLWESLFRLVQTRPWDLPRALFWLLEGKAAFKRRIVERVEVDPSTLPYREAMLERVRSARAGGARVVLATASDERLARPVASYLGLFDAVLASDGRVNLSGVEKRRAIERDAGGAGFEYAGNSPTDFGIWSGAERAILVDPSRGTIRRASRLSIPVEVLPHDRHVGRALLRALRPHQWVKNLLLFVPLLLAHTVTDLDRIVATVLAFAGFCACSSGTYVLNDLLDLDADRVHPRKRHRPLAAGTLSIPAGIAASAVLLLLGVGGPAVLVGPMVAGMLTAYVALTLLYSAVLKRLVFVDVLVLAGLFAHRVLTGAVAAQVVISPWLLVFSLFFFLSLATVKRYAELLAARSRSLRQLSRRGYEVGDIELVQSIGLASGYMAVLVIGLYVSSEDVRRLYARPQLLWLICPLLLYWITRIWFLARRGRVSEDPVLFAATDPVSYGVGALVLLCGTLAS
jgi:4-hydroxybenzoate polyprenyltransferase